MLFGEMLSKSKEIQDLIGVPRGRAGQIEGAMGAVRESAELLDALAPGYRPWKAAPTEEADLEAIDILNFVLAYFVARDLTADQVDELFMAKNKVLLERINRKVAPLVMDPMFELPTVQ